MRVGSKVFRKTSLKIAIGEMKLDRSEVGVNDGVHVAEADDDTPSKSSGETLLTLNLRSAEIELAKPSGYIASTVGAHSRSAPSASSIAESSASWRG